MGRAHERAGPDIFNAVLLAEPPGEHGLSQAGIAEDHDRLVEREYPVLANDRLPAVLPLVRERSFDPGWHRLHRRLGHDRVLDLYRSPGSIVHRVVIYCPIKSRHPPRDRPTIAVSCLRSRSIPCLP